MLKPINSVRCIKPSDPLIYADSSTKSVMYNHAAVSASLDGLREMRKTREKQLEEELAKPIPNVNRIYKLHEIIYDINRSLNDHQR